MIEFDFNGIDDFQYLINEFENPVSVLRAIAAYDKAKMIYNVNTGLDPYNRPYTPLEIRYAQRKRQQYGDKPILIRTGRMIKGYRQRITANGYSVSIDSPYVKYHQSSEPRTKIPRRMILPDSDMGLPAQYQAKLIELAFEHYEMVLYRLRERRVSI